jgi:transposase
VANGGIARGRSRGCTIAGLARLVPAGRPTVREAIEAVGAELRYLPPYSPDLNPIELAFAKLKKLLRDGADRTADKLWDLCGRLLDEFTEAECRDYFKHCGYRYT